MNWLLSIAHCCLIALQSIWSCIFSDYRNEGDNSTDQNSDPLFTASSSSRTRGMER